MSRVISPVTGKPYGLAAVCRAWRLARKRGRHSTLIERKYAADHLHNVGDIKLTANFHRIEVVPFS